MKKALITLNLLLAGIAILLAFNSISLKNNVDNKKAQEIRKKSGEKKSKSQKNDTGSGGTASLRSAKDAADKIVEQDMFNQIRSPLANVRVGRSDMTLLGVFKMGDVEGAIIKTNQRQQQFNPYLAQAMRMSASMSGRPAQGGGRFTNWSQVSGNRRSQPAKQYVRLGETMSNGYTLAEVTRGRVVLVRGNDKLELELQDPSKNKAAARHRSRRLNSTQQFQQAQMYMQSQMIRTMREIQQNSRSGGSQGGNRNRR